MITPEEEAELARRIRTGDQGALQKLVSANLRFVVSVAKQYQNNYLTLNDLINEGNLGLIKAARKFDETRGFKFISYAVWWIRQSIIQAISEQSRLVRLPVNKVGELSRLNRMFAELEQKYEREPTHEELSEGLNIDSVQLAAAMKAAPKHISMDAPFQEGEGTALIDIVENPDCETTDNTMAYTHSLKIDTERTLAALTETQRQVIKMFFGLGEEPNSLEDIGRKLGLSRERIRQIKDHAIKKLRTLSRRGLLHDYLCR